MTIDDLLREFLLTRPDFAPNAKSRRVIGMFIKGHSAREIAAANGWTQVGTVYHDPGWSNRIAVLCAFITWLAMRA